MSTADILLIIGALSLAAVNIITALKVKAIAHSVNSAATTSGERIEALTNTVAALRTELAVAKRKTGRR